MAARLPSELSAVEGELRDALRQSFERGHLAVSVRWVEDAAQAAGIDWVRATAVVEALRSLRDRYALDPDQVPFDYYELIAALAPAAFFSNSPLRDSNFDWRGVEKVAPQVRRIYELHNVPEKMRIAYPDDEHDFPTIEREESYRFIERWLE